MDRNFKIESQQTDENAGAAQRYMDLIIGKRGYGRLIGFELIMLLCSRMPGALGLFLRQKLYPKLLGACGCGVVFGTNVSLRHPHKIRIGNNVIIDDNVMLDAKGVEGGEIILADGVFVGRNSIIGNKDGIIEIGERSNIGFNCIVAATSSIKIGKDCIFAAYTYIVGGGNYKVDEIEGPMAANYDYEGKGGVVIGDDVWLGSRVTVLDGVTIHNGAVVSAGGVVTKDCPENTISMGVPAKVIRQRR